MQIFTDGTCRARIINQYGIIYDVLVWLVVAVRLPNALSSDFKVLKFSGCVVREGRTGSGGGCREGVVRWV